VLSIMSEQKESDNNNN